MDTSSTGTHKECVLLYVECHLLIEPTFPQKAVLKTKPELLSAELRNTMGCFCALYSTIHILYIYLQFTILPIECCNSCSGFLGQKWAQWMTTVGNLPIYNGTCSLGTPYCRHNVRCTRTRETSPVHTRSTVLYSELEFLNLSGVRKIAMKIEVD